jgi:hypothetical protein
MGGAGASARAALARRERRGRRSSALFTGSRRGSGAGLCLLPRSCSCCGEMVIPNVAAQAMSKAAPARPSVTIVQHIAANGDREVARIARQETIGALKAYDREVGEHGLAGRRLDHEGQSGVEQVLAILVPDIHAELTGHVTICLPL